MQNRLPISFIEETASLFASQAEREAFLLSISEDGPSISVRLNPFKPSSRFNNEEIVGWCHDGRYLSHRPSFTLDPVFWGGAYYPQEASSMIVGEIVRKLSPKRILDLCAAPGGKTTHMSSVIDDDAFIISNEVIPNRAKTLVENVQRWGRPNVMVTSTQPKNFSRLSGYFDLILADVPCSGEGMFRKDPQAISEWSPDAVSSCVSRSKSILSDVWNALASGGYMVFSTCTYNRHEDEEMVDFIINQLGAEYISLDDILPGSAVTTGRGYHFFPHKTRGEGFFVALLQKNSGISVVSSKNRTIEKFRNLTKQEYSLVKEYSMESDLEFRMVGDKCYGFTDVMVAELDYLRFSVAPVYSGVQFGKIIAGKLKPSHSLALYSNVTPVNISRLSLEEAVHYLRKDTQSPDLFINGLSAVSYDDVIIGWANRVQGRVNNLYPSEQRIRLSF